MTLPEFNLKLEWILRHGSLHLDHVGGQCYSAYFNGQVERVKGLRLSISGSTAVEAIEALLGSSQLQPLIKKDAKQPMIQPQPVKKLYGRCCNDECELRATRISRVNGAFYCAQHGPNP